MKRNKINNQRTCIFSKQKFLKNEMLRFVIYENKIIFNNPTKRGYYLKIDKSTKIDLVLKMIANRFKIININECQEFLKTYISKISQ